MAANLQLCAARGQAETVAMMIHGIFLEWRTICCRSCINDVDWT
jgi:hypothetical protein